METSSKVTHIADTALWVATFRAMENERPDAAFRDPHAACLTGERGRKIAAAIGSEKFMHWLLVVRTVAIDELVKRAISLGADTVVNLGAGLDTRPYRMDLPASLRWIEVDFPQMIQYKAEKLVGEKPVCNLVRIEADLSDVPLRRKLFARLGSESKKVLLITEGVTPYLSPSDAEALSHDLFAVPTFAFWIQDYRQGSRGTGMPSRMRRMLKETPFKFNVADSLGFFEKHGWRILEKRLAADEADRLKRPFPVPFPWTLIVPLIPKKTQEKFRNAVGYVMYERPSATPQ